MTTLNFVANLRSSAILSETSASTDQTTLPFIPGACFLGVVAASLYAELGDKAFDVFHSGHVRFGNAYPLDPKGLPMFPIPLSWHYLKNKSFHDDSKLLLPALDNYVFVPDVERARRSREGKQYKQVRSGWFSESGNFMETGTSFDLKTAVDRNKGGRAEESQLFGYESLGAARYEKHGGRWYFSVDVDLQDETQIDLIRKALTDDLIRVGRSRSSQYGLTRVEYLPTTVYKHVPRVCQADGSANQVVLYCLSDVALRDPKTGSPKLEPDASSFYLSDGEYVIDPSSTFVRTRRYTPFNGKRHSYDLERQVISLGSVICFKKINGSLSEIELSTIQHKLNQGVGLYRFDGLGRVLANPSFLLSEHPTIGSSFNAGITSMSAQAPAKLTTSQQDLVSWLDGQRRERQLEGRASILADEWTMSFLDVTAAGPSKAQWSGLADVAARSTDMERLKLELFDKTIGYCTTGVSAKDWGKECRIFEGKYAGRRTYCEHLGKMLAACGADFALTRRSLILFAVRMPHKLNQKEVAHG